MADYYIQLIDRSPFLVRETPLGVYEGATPLAAIRAAQREWGLSASDPEAFSTTPIGETHPSAAFGGSDVQSAAFGASDIQ